MVPLLWLMTRQHATALRGALRELGFDHVAIRDMGEECQREGIYTVADLARHIRDNAERFDRRPDAQQQDIGLAARQPTYLPPHPRARAGTTDTTL
eukprot:11180418-Lingulodinium_polyedra.AAC.1